MANSISGNAGTPSVIMTLINFSLGVESQATADGSGNYTFSTLSAGVYYILPSLAGFTFSPYVSTQTIVSSDITGVNFTASAFTPTGVWTKYGDVNLLTPSSAQASSLGGTQPTGPCALYDSNPQVITANPDGKVWKMWYMDGVNIRYAEANVASGPWTVKSGNILANASWVTVYKSGSTYYHYIKVSGNANLHSYTSSDGVTLSLQNASALAPSGASGTWDSGGIYQLTVSDQIAGTWYAIYTALSGAPGTLFSQHMGLATSSDLLTWTASGSNPVILNAAAADVHKVGSTYYAWVNSCELHLSTSGGASFQYTFPNSIFRLSSTDLINWGNRIMALPRTLLGEGANTMDSQTGNQCLIELNGITYMFYMGTNRGSGDGGLTPTNFLTLLATAPKTIAALITTNEGVSYSPQSAIDSFNRANENPLTQSGNWMTVPGSGFGGVQLASNLVEPISIATWGMMQYTGASFTDNQYVECVLNTCTATTTRQTILPLRITSNGTSSYNDYQFTVVGISNLGVSQVVTVGKVVAGSFTSLSTATITPHQYDVFRFQVVKSGNTDTLTAYQNGVIISGLTFAATSSGVPSGGNPGIQLYNSDAVANTTISGWAAGNSGAIPGYSALSNHQQLRLRRES
jgi:hypothetical protein